MDKINNEILNLMLILENNSLKYRYCGLYDNRECSPYNDLKKALKSSNKKIKLDAIEHCKAYIKHVENK